MRSICRPIHSCIKVCLKQVIDRRDHAHVQILARADIYDLAGAQLSIVIDTHEEVRDCLQRSLCRRKADADKGLGIFDFGFSILRARGKSRNNRSWRLSAKSRWLFSAFSGEI